MSWNKILDYLDSEGFEFSYNADKHLVNIYRGKTTIATLVKSPSEWWLVKYNNRFKVVTTSAKNPLDLIAGAQLL